MPSTVGESDSFATSAGVRERMQRQRSRDTGPELALRRALHRLGYRYRIHIRPVPTLRRTADVVFTRAHVAVFVDGCFWHGCPEHGSRMPAANSWYWPDKISRNRDRDVDTTEQLSAAGWTVVRIWEHEPLDEAIARVVAAVCSTLVQPVEQPE
jgi:DNA mismatch endonuclease (patch repair protein)